MGGGVGSPSCPPHDSTLSCADASSEPAPFSSRSSLGGGGKEQVPYWGRPSRPKDTAERRAHGACTGRRVRVQKRGAVGGKADARVGRGGPGGRRWKRR